jgi:predicted RNA polymerase sigma factor
VAIAAAALNRAVVLAEVDGLEAAREVVAALEREGRLNGYRYLFATTGDLLLRLGGTRCAGLVAETDTQRAHLRPNGPVPAQARG